jgi:hypothetical protein
LITVIRVGGVQLNACRPVVGRFSATNRARPHDWAAVVGRPPGRGPHRRGGERALGYGTDLAGIAARGFLPLASGCSARGCLVRPPRAHARCGGENECDARFYHDGLDIFDPHHRMIASHRLVAKMPTIAAMAYKYSQGAAFRLSAQRSRLPRKLPQYALFGTLRALQRCRHRGLPVSSRRAASSRSRRFVRGRPG